MKTWLPGPDCLPRLLPQAWPSGGVCFSHPPTLFPSTSSRKPSLTSSAELQHYFVYCPLASMSLSVPGSLSRLNPLWAGKPLKASMSPSAGVPAFRHRLHRLLHASVPRPTLAERTEMQSRPAGLPARQRLWVPLFPSSGPPTLPSVPGRTHQGVSV